jgi:hypothetical protein
MIIGLQSKMVLIEAFILFHNLLCSYFSLNRTPRLSISEGSQPFILEN